MLIRSLLDVQMHSIARVTLITLLGFTVSIAQAQDADDSIGRDDTPFYSGTAFISVDPDLDNLDSAFGLAQTIGIRIPGISWIGFELDLGFTLFGGENDGGRTIPAGGGMTAPRCKTRLAANSPVPRPPMMTFRPSPMVCTPHSARRDGYMPERGWALAA